MAKAASMKIFVFAHWQGLNQPELMGTLYTNRIRGKEIFHFEYQNDWLKSDRSMQIDPDLQLYTGPQYTRDNKDNFGIFLDSSPDRWGRLLMRRREAALAKKDKRSENTLFESDYLLGVYDGHRMGAVRFKEELEGPFLDNNQMMSTPPWTSLRNLEQASLALEQDNVVDDPDYLKWLNMLMAPGSSLGGSRPKASVVDNKKSLWIAKFPSKLDQHDVGAWEMVVNELAVKAGLNVAECKVQKFASNKFTFLTKRFDRTPDNSRIHFASAMTLLGYKDGADFQSGASYLELADFIKRHGAKVKEDLEELWRRIVFSISVKNTDDHLRNHGFLLNEKGWILSPAYDINPIATGTGLSLNISQNENSLDLNVAMDVAAQFYLDEKKALGIIDKVKAVVKTWQSIAEKYKISRNEQALMQSAFSEGNSHQVLSKKQLLCNAIKKKQRVSFLYNEKERIGEPQCCGISAMGKDVVRMHLIRGGSRPEQLFELSKMQSLRLLEEYFTLPGPNYTPDDKAMSNIYCQL
jgi:serine/threonine-protein kinase HipA